MSRRARSIEFLRGCLSVQLKIHGTTTLSVGDKVNLTLPITGKTHGGSEIETNYQGDFLITKLRHIFNQSERRHTIAMSVIKDSTPFEYNNAFDSSEPKGSNGQTIIQ